MTPRTRLRNCWSSIKARGIGTILVTLGFRQLQYSSALVLGSRRKRAAVTRFAEAEGIQIISEHVKVETGKRGMPWIAARRGARSCESGQMQRPGRQA
jgi:hypothetical protein